MRTLTARFRGTREVEQLSFSPLSPQSHGEQEMHGHVGGHERLLQAYCAAAQRKDPSQRDRNAAAHQEHLMRGVKSRNEMVSLS